MIIKDLNSMIADVLSSLWKNGIFIDFLSKVAYSIDNYEVDNQLMTPKRLARELVNRLGMLDDDTLALLLFGMPKKATDIPVVELRNIANAIVYGERFEDRDG